ncbi:MAG: VOC family protein [Ferrimicrobium sp.]
MAILASFARVYVADINEGIALFRRSPEEAPRLRFSRASGLELVLVGDVLVLAGSEDVLRHFRATQVTLVVDDLDGALIDAATRHSVLRGGPEHQVTGRNATVGYPGGAMVEYVEWSLATRVEAGLD